MLATGTLKLQINNATWKEILKSDRRFPGFQGLAEKFSMIEDGMKYDGKAENTELSTGDYRKYVRFPGRYNIGKMYLQILKEKNDWVFKTDNKY